MRDRHAPQRQTDGTRYEAAGIIRDRRNLGMDQPVGHSLSRRRRERERADVSRLRRALVREHGRGGLPRALCGPGGGGRGTGGDRRALRRGRRRRDQAWKTSTEILPDDGDVRRVDPPESRPRTWVAGPGQLRGRAEWRARRRRRATHARERVRMRVRRTACRHNISRQALLLLDESPTTRPLAPGTPRGARVQRIPPVGPSARHPAYRSGAAVTPANRASQTWR